MFDEKSFECKGSACHLQLLCHKCGLVFTFYSSKKIKNSFDTNKRFVYAMKCIGKGHTWMKNIL